MISLMKIFADEKLAEEFFIQHRWPNGVFCPYCLHEEVYELKRKSTTKLRSHLKIWKCALCRKQFSVKVGTVFHNSRMPLNKWLFAFYMLTSAKKGVSAKELERKLEISYKAAWSMSHRIRQAMQTSPLRDKLKGEVEVDETYIGGYKPGVTGRGSTNKLSVVTMVERDGQSRSVHVKNLKAPVIHKILTDEIGDDAHVITDKFRSYAGLDEKFAQHSTISHKKYYRWKGVHTQHVECFFSHLKRIIKANYHHVSEKHIGLYLAEIDFFWNTRGMTDRKKLEYLLNTTDLLVSVWRVESVAGVGGATPSTLIK